jgi:hypothetical protein
VVTVGMMLPFLLDVCGFVACRVAVVSDGGRLGVSGS